MKIKSTLTLTCFIFHSLFVIPCFAQGTSITYQGRLTTNGVAFAGSAEFQFTLWDAVSGGNAVATNNPTSLIASVDSNGVFTATLDFGSNPFNGQPRFLEPDVRTVIGPFTTLSRQPITATPYAVRALNLTTNGLAGTYGNAVTFNNAGNSFAGTFVGTSIGDGSGLTNISAATLGGLAATAFWKTNGNAGANPTNGTFLGTTDNLPLELHVNNQRALRLEPTPTNPNLVVGTAVNGIVNGVVGGTIAGGSANHIFSTDFSTVAGGNRNEIGGGVGPVPTAFGCNFIGAGIAIYITTNCNYCFIGSGDQNSIQTNSDNGFIGAGMGCRIAQASPSSAIVGGFLNNINPSNLDAFIGGGAHNLINSGTTNGVIVGGGNNTIAAGVLYATIPGGFSNRVSGDYGFAAGRQAKADHDGSFVWADSQSADFASTATNQFLIRAGGGVGIGVTNPTRELEVQHAGDTEIGIKSTDANGHLWTLQSSAGSGGGGNLDASFQIIDRTFNAPRLLIATNGNVGIGTTSPTNKLHVAGGVSATAFVTTSDRNAKENFVPVSSAEVLDKVLALPITTWNFKDLHDGRHMGPMAQDFYAAFGLGGSDKTITSVDPDGVALAAIQGLNRKLEQRLEQKEAEIAELKQRLESLEKIIREPKPN